MHLLAAEIVDTISRGKLPGLQREASYPLRQDSESYRIGLESHFETIKCHIGRTLVV
jgi:hypothetical protein